MPKEWTKEEQKMLNKAAKELPVGTRDRYEKIAEYMQVHGRTTYRRPVKVCIFVSQTAAAHVHSYPMAIQEVIARIKNQQNCTESLKQKANENAFENLVCCNW